MEKDWDYIARLEKAIKQKYGDDAVQNPSKFWDEEKEKEYIEQLKELAKKQIDVDDRSEKIEIDGFLVNKKLVNKDNKNNCPICGTKVKLRDERIYLLRWQCCKTCYAQYVEFNWERWTEGWRPENVEKNT